MTGEKRRNPGNTGQKKAQALRYLERQTNFHAVLTLFESTHDTAERVRLAAIYAKANHATNEEIRDAIIRGSEVKK